MIFRKYGIISEYAQETRIVYTYAAITSKNSDEIGILVLIFEEQTDIAFYPFVTEDTDK